MVYHQINIESYILSKVHTSELYIGAEKHGKIETFPRAYFSALFSSFYTIHQTIQRFYFMQFAIFILLMNYFLISS